MAPRKTSKEKPTPKAEKNAKIAEQICDLIAIGTPVRDAAKEAGVSVPTIYRWIYKDADFREQYARAKEACQEKEAEEIVRLADEATPENERVMRLRIDARKWNMAKLAPKRFGDRQQIDMTVKDGDKDDDELLHEFRTAAETLGVDPAALLASIKAPS